MTLPPLPIDEVLPLLIEVVRDNSSAVLHAPPGAGKTTRVPLALMQHVPGRIVVLEPRRLAAISAARWMSHLLAKPLGEVVGYSIRHERMVGKSARVEVVTEGLLTRRLQADPSLEATGLVIFDEFHERSLHADLALALCIESQQTLRPDLKILVMSATLDTEPIAKLLGGAPVVRSEGKSYPVRERYIDMGRDAPIALRVAQTVREALAHESGDMLVFLPGAREIRACARALEDLPRGITIHPLYGDMPLEQQRAAIEPGPTRRVVLATNIAQTSLTIEGIGVVIDSGLERRMQHDPASSTNRLTTGPCSRAAAQQRAGRAGRLGPGVCYRLYSKGAYAAMLPFTPPEILTTDLSSFTLELAAWGARDADKLALLDQPPASSMDAARRLLAELGALDAAGRITDKGRRMAALPLHPRLAALALCAVEIGAAHLGAQLAAILSERDVLKAAEADQDVMERLEALRNFQAKGQSHPLADTHALKAADRSARQIASMLNASSKDVSFFVHATVARLMLAAYPDRIGRARPDGMGRYVLANAKGVRLPTISPMSTEEFIVAAEVDTGGHAGEGIIHMALAVQEEDIRAALESAIIRERKVYWDSREARVKGQLIERIGAVALSASTTFNPDDEEAAAIICEAVKADPALVAPGPKCRQLQGRVQVLRNAFPNEPWPDMSDDALFAEPSAWLAPWLQGARTREQLRKLDLAPALLAMLTYDQQRQLAELAPERIRVPSGRDVAVDYSSGPTPVLSVKLQEMFGLADTPTVARGRVKVLLHLLSPAQRPVQVTQDLKGFWDGSYREVRRELKGRYPKHPWPEDPWNTPPTNRTKKPRQK